MPNTKPEEWAANHLSIDDKPVAGNIVEHFDDSVTITVTTKPCLQCRERTVLQVPSDGYDAWCQGKYIQDALPLLSDDQRELLMTGTHRECWDEIFPPDGDDE